MIAGPTTMARSRRIPLTFQPRRGTCHPSIVTATRQHAADEELEDFILIPPSKLDTNLKLSFAHHGRQTCSQEEDHHHHHHHRHWDRDTTFKLRIRTSNRQPREEVPPTWLVNNTFLLGERRSFPSCHTRTPPCCTEKSRIVNIDDILLPTLD